MNNLLKSPQYKDLSKADVIGIIREIIQEEVRIRTKDNYSDEEFNSPSWAMRQAANGGVIRFCNKLLNSIPNKEI